MRPQTEAERLIEAELATATDVVVIDSFGANAMADIVDGQPGVPTA